MSDIAAEVAGYADVAQKIINLAVSGAAQNRSYTRLADFTDTIGNRLSGSQNLDMAIKYMYTAMTQDGLDVHLGDYFLLYRKYAMGINRRNQAKELLFYGLSFRWCNSCFIIIIYLFHFILLSRAGKGSTLGEREGECRNDFTQIQKSSYTRPW